MSQHPWNKPMLPVFVGLPAQLGSARKGIQIETQASEVR
jgi:hypothetical protein